MNGGTNLVPAFFHNDQQEVLWDRWQLFEVDGLGRTFLPVMGQMKDISRLKRGSSPRKGERSCGTENKGNEVMLELYRALVRPQLEYH
eukprot:g38126.t1